jgi:hypothetical protein
MMDLYKAKEDSYFLNKKRHNNSSTTISLIFVS